MSDRVKEIGRWTFDHRPCHCDVSRHVVEKYLILIKFMFLILIMNMKKGV